MKILVTGAMGFIGSHTAVEILNHGDEVVLIDDFSNAKRDVLGKIKQITKKEIPFYEGNIKDKNLLRDIFKEHKIDVVIHFAGYKAVGESVQNPLKYYDNNLISTIHLLEIMKEAGCKKLVFSSSATVYGSPKELPIKEDFPLSTTNPYGTTKLMIEKILKDLCMADPLFSVVILRYFNPVGAHESGYLGEDPNGIPNNLMPYIVKVANGELSYLRVFGNDYDTKDGTGVRDYIHVVDLAKGHIKACEKVMQENKLHIYNLGTGKGYSVLDLISCFEKVTKTKIPYKIVERRSGDIASCYADVNLALKELGFKAEKDIEKMCRDSYLYIQKNK